MGSFAPIVRLDSNRNNANKRRKKILPTPPSPPSTAFVVQPLQPTMLQPPAILPTPPSPPSTALVVQQPPLQPTLLQHTTATVAVDGSVPAIGYDSLGSIVSTSAPPSTAFVLQQPPLQPRTMLQPPAILPTTPSPPSTALVVQQPALQPTILFLPTTTTAAVDGSVPASGYRSWGTIVTNAINHAMRPPTLLRSIILHNISS